MIFRHVVYDAQFSFVTIYKVGKCMMPSALKICSDFKSRVVYSSLKTELEKLCMLCICWSRGRLILRVVLVNMEFISCRCGVSVH